MGERAACIDVGSNTVRLLVGDLNAAGTIRPVVEERAFSAPATAEHLRGVIARQAKAARVAGADQLRIVGTAMLRERPGLAAMLRDASDGPPLEILTAEEEARLAFAGATQGLRRHDGDVAVVDVGGGSTEIAVGTLQGVRWCASAPVGSRTLCETCGLDDPPTEAQLAEVAERAAEALAGLACPHAPSLALAAGGSATTTARLVGPDLTPEALERVLAMLRAAPAQEIAARHNLDPRRARVLPAGLIVLRAAEDALGTPLRIGAGGLREGVVLDLLACG